MNALVPFTFDTRPVRAVERDGQHWFIANDVCQALGLANPRDAIAKLDADEKGVVISDTLGGAQEMAVLSEAGVYTLALRCRYAMTPGTAPYRFRKWITGDVLPALRRDGAYGGSGAVAALNDPAALRGLLLGYTERVMALEHRAGELEHENAALAPKADALDRIAQSEGAMSITAAAKALAVGPKVLHDWLRAHGWTYRRQPDGRIMAYQTKVDAHLLEQRLVTVPGERGAPSRSYWQVLVTAKGITRLAELLGARAAA